MSDIYSEGHRELQDKYASRALADRTAEAIVHSVLTEQDIAFIAERDFFFLSTVNSHGEPTVSYKGGGVGFVAVSDNTLLFPCFDGNGMYLSCGNLASNPNVGLLFIDFERPRRLRVQGVARIDEGAQNVPGAQFMVRVTPRQIFVNCPRYIHKHKRVETSRYIPQAEGISPLAEWKRLPIVHDVLSAEDQAAATKAGPLTLEEYQAKVDAGDG